jgi:hypothetical protein
MKSGVGKRSSLARWLASSVLLLSVGLMAADSAAVETREFLISQAAQFEQGTLEGVGISSDGYLVTSPSKESLARGLDTYVWRLVSDDKGRVYAATGSDGKLFVIDGSGEVLREIQSHEYELFAVALDPEGRAVYAGAPNGTVQRVAEGTESQTLFDVPEGIVWNLAVGSGGEIYAATGERGRIYEIKPDGSTRTLHQSAEAHIVSMAVGPDGNLLAGTDNKGLLIAIDSESGDAKVLYDASQEEIAEILVMGDGSILFGANGALTSSPGGNGEPNTEFALKIGPEPAGPVLYRMDSEGMVTDLWRCPEEDILSLAPVGDGSVWVGTGSKGVLFRVYPDGTSDRVATFDENQVLSLLATKRGLVVGTGNAGALYRLVPGGTTKGTYTSEVHDAGATSRWGAPRINSRIPEGSRITLQTRTGATKDVGNEWSSWAAVDLEGGAAVASPPNRYFQWRVEVESQGPSGRDGVAIYEVAIPYLRPNRPPRIAKLLVSADAPKWSAERGGRAGTMTQFLEGGVKVDYTFPEAGNKNGSMVNGRAAGGPWARAFRSAVWDAQDPDGDRLIYEVSFRPLDDETWTVLEEEIRQPGYTWDASAWPDGRYVLRVSATDSEDNPEAWALRTAAESVPFEVDNTPPILESLKARVVSDGDGKRVELTGRAVDEASRIAWLEVSFDGKGWRPMSSADGILDSRIESFDASVSIEAGEQPRFVAVRARDEVGHPVVGRAEIVP